MAYSPIALPPLLDAMAIHEKQSLGVPDSGVKSRALVLVILRILMADGGWRMADGGMVIAALFSDLLRADFTYLG